MNEPFNFLFHGFLWALAIFMFCKIIIWYNFYRDYNTQEYCARCGEPLPAPNLRHNGACHNCGANGPGMPTTSRRVAKMARENFEKTGGKPISDDTNKTESNSKDLMGLNREIVKLKRRMANGDYGVAFLLAAKRAQAGTISKCSN
jgi:hypothetical protein